jgi:hypothetical protein
MLQTHFANDFPKESCLSLLRLNKDKGFSGLMKLERNGR